MRTRAAVTGVVWMLASLALAGPNTITYQGCVVSGSGGPVADGNYKMRFSVFTVATGGSNVWQETDANVAVTNGLFSTTLGDGLAFGALFANNANLWLEVAIDLNKNGSLESNEVYSPRQKMAGAPWAMDADTVDGRHASQLGGWLLTGNAGTTSGTSFLGTTDMKPLDLCVNNIRAFRIMPTWGAPNIIGGRRTAVVRALDAGATIAGGENNTAGDHAVVGGGFGNTASSICATVGGGDSNTASDRFSTVGGGHQSTASSWFATVGGGESNLASAWYATVGGGNDSSATAHCSTIGGGNGNTASDENATVGGGSGNTASGREATVGGGYSNTASGGNATVGGGNSNTASGYGATIGGGESNTASNYYATVPGGAQNRASARYSLAAGRSARAIHTGSFVWGDSQPYYTTSTADNQFSVRATGGVRFISGIDGDGNPTHGVQLLAGADSWTPLPTPSDRNLKTNFAPADERTILERLETIPIQTWNYNYQEPSIRHIGPMAQDFYRAFEVGEDDRHIDTIDANGVALAAIQGLYKLVQEKDARIAAQREQIAELAKRLAVVESLLTPTSPRQ